MPTQQPPFSRPAKRRLGVWLLPLGIFLGFALLFALLFRDRLLPGKAVDVVPAVGIEETLVATETTKDRHVVIQVFSLGKLLFG
jgi:hypothetical protein